MRQTPHPRPFSIFAKPKIEKGALPRTTSRPFQGVNWQKKAPFSNRALFALLEKAKLA
jgi:hypothetical protein